MQRRATIAWSFATLALGSLLLTGCTGGQDAKVSAQRAKFMLSSEPAGAIGVRQARAMVKLGPSDSTESEAKAPDPASAEKPASATDAAAGPVKPSDAHADHADEAEDHAHAAAEKHSEDDHAGHEHADAHASHDHAGHDHAHGNHAHSHDGKNVIIVGSIGGISDPWEKGKAMFMIADVGDEQSYDNAHAGHDHAAHDHADHDHAHDDHGHHHAHGEDHQCAFCERAKAGVESLAIVQFVDERGNPLAVDARDLFDIKAKQTVVIRGRATLDKLGNLVVTANGLYVRP